MSIPEAAQLVIQAGAMAKGGEVFVLDMGQPVRIINLALQLNDVPTIRLQMQHLVPGYTPNEAIVDWVYLQQQAG